MRHLRRRVLASCTGTGKSVLLCLVVVHARWRCQLSVVQPFFTCSADWELGQIDSERDEASILVAHSPQLAVRDVFTPLIQLQVPCWSDSRLFSVCSGLEPRVRSRAQLLCRQTHKLLERVSSSGRECRNGCLEAPVFIWRRKTWLSGEKSHGSLQS